MVRCLGFVCLAVVLLSSAETAAEDGCEKFAWSLSRERAWFAAADKPSVAAGDSLTAIPNGAFTLSLRPGSEATFELPPEKKPRSDRWFGGIVRLPALREAGIYQVTVSDEVWIDVIQDNRYARSVGSTGRSDCPGLRKSVRLELGVAPFVLQLSAVTMPTIVIGISRTD